MIVIVEAMVRFPEHRVHDIDCGSCRLQLEHSASMSCAVSVVCNTPFSQNAVAARSSAV